MLVVTINKRPHLVVPKLDGTIMESCRQERLFRVYRDGREA